MAGNPFIPDELEQFAKKLPQYQAQAERILNLTEALLVDGHAALKDMRAEAAAIRKSLKDAL